MFSTNWSPNVTNSSPNVSKEMMAPFQTTNNVDPNMSGGNAVMPTSLIEMTLSCRSLMNKDILSKSDPFCLVLMKDSWSDKFNQIGRTETVKDNLNPEWIKKFVISYNFETVQKMRFEVWDVDPEKSEFLGEFETTLAEIVAYSGRQFVGKLTGVADTDGRIIIVTEELSACKQIVTMQFRAKDLTKKSIFWRNDPFLVISRSNEDGTHSVVMKSEPSHSTQNPLWLPINMRVRTLCNGDYDRTIKIDCFDNRSNGNHKLIGSCHTSLRQLSLGPNENKYPLINAIKQKQKSNYSNSGFLELNSISITEEITFLDYIRSGTQMHFAVAIDFTASNGPPRDPQSLHFLDTYGNRPNPYEIALRSVGEIIQPYDSAGMFPAFGFGAKLPPTGEVSHQFPLNGNTAHPYCSGIQEILDHYRTRLASITLYGPTNFSNVINNTASIARQFQDGKHYFVLLIITDGIISDMIQTKNAIVNASRLPMSVIIVGVGNAEFAAMDELDSDDVRLQVDGRYAERDIVQFVPLNKYLLQNKSFIKSQADLAKEVLAEIPDQMTGYMRSKGFKPIISQNVPTNQSSVPSQTTPNAPPISPIS